jgi:hypothetical protein
MIDRVFPLPGPLNDLVLARDAVRDHYARILRNRNATTTLNFTFDGNLVGDLGEAIAVEYFGLVLEQRKSNEGVDGHCGGRSVQVKATGTSRGPAFRNTQTRADHLLFFELDFERRRAELVYNGPEHIAFSMLPPSFDGQRSLTNRQIRIADKEVEENDRLKPIKLPR